MSDLKKYIEKQMQDPEFREEFEASEAEYQVMRTLISARLEEGMTQNIDFMRKTSLPNA